ncbi:methyltransferase domain-containing protein [Streptomyces sp. CS7]|uniref:SAM-dependent methyltransferase n=1 Tax=Streptomyces sp. CS-7 TaxID=2906769 RepID=UPI0021B19452|nr:methyltransferase domain-containing protein [Streptomyces sp. CS-7]MCT6778698.1 methyltransferase domain-containing protein [Streptomyces sp. CS-7]
MRPEKRWSDRPEDRRFAWFTIRALRLAPGTRALDLASGSGELLCTWARDHGVTGTGVDISTVFTEKARSRAAELGVADRVSFVHGDASGFVADEPVGLAACVGATWIERFGDLGYDVVEMVLADQDSWDRYRAAQWLNLRHWLDAHPDDGMAAEVRAELTTGPARYARYQREYLGWGVFALMAR